MIRFSNYKYASLRFSFLCDEGEKVVLWLHVREAFAEQQNIK